MRRAGDILLLRDHNLHAILACVQVTYRRALPREHGARASDLRPRATSTRRVPAQELQLRPVRGRRRARADADPDQAAAPPRGRRPRPHAQGGRELVLISLPAASRMVDDLFRRGFVERHEDAEDRRMKRVCLTDGGRVRDPPAERRPPERARAVHRDLDRRRATQALRALSKLLEREDVAACRPGGPHP